MPNVAPVSAIPTEYAGCRFRSRLEARWAVFFDAIGLRWDYEPEGFALPSGWYLPDFWISSLDAWVEVKGRHLDAREERLCRELAILSERDVYALVGSLSDHRDRTSDLVCVPFMICKNEDFSFEVGWDSHYGFVECLECHRVSIQFGGYSSRGCCGNEEESSEAGRTPRLLQAYTLALSARFEHGEVPRPSEVPSTRDVTTRLAHQMAENDRRSRARAGW